ncbi:MAG: hypothetical protein WBW55_02235 [Desulfobaccales bacterium]
MRSLKTIITIFLFLTLSTAAYPQEDPGTAREQPGSVKEDPGTAKEEPGPAQEKAAAAKEDDRLPIHKEGWQFFLAPYLWIPGLHADVSHQDQFSGTTVVDVPWYDVVPLLFSKAMGGMGRVEIWNGRWGLFSDTNFVYIEESVTAAGARELKLNGHGLPTPIPVSLQLSGTAKFWTRLLFQDVGVRYLLGSVPLSAEKSLPVLTCELLGGLRYTYLNQDTSLGPECHLNRTLGQRANKQGRLFFRFCKLFGCGTAHRSASWLLVDPEA